MRVILTLAVLAYLGIGLFVWFALSSHAQVARQLGQASKAVATKERVFASLFWFIWLPYRRQIDKKSEGR